MTWAFHHFLFLFQKGLTQYGEWGSAICEGEERLEISIFNKASLFNGGAIDFHLDLIDAMWALYVVQIPKKLWANVLLSFLFLEKMFTPPSLNMVTTAIVISYPDNDESNVDRKEDNHF